MSEIAVVWFRQDLRIQDNLALISAAKSSKVMPVYILDDENSGKHFPGSASRVWLHNSLCELNKSFDGQLNVFRGDPLRIFIQLCTCYKIKEFYWNRCYEPWRIKRDKIIKHELTKKGFKVNSYNGSLLWEPWEVKKKDGKRYKVFTPFYKYGCMSLREPRKPFLAPAELKLCNRAAQSLTIDDLNLLPSRSWYKKVFGYWQAGESGANKLLLRFLDNGLENYQKGRDFPAKTFVSRLSSYLHFGELSPYQVWDAISKKTRDQNSAKFCSELAWREFSYNQLYYCPEMVDFNIQSKFDNFPWQKNHNDLVAWQQGQTGVPLVDAAMRELWQTGYIHNRSRMIAGSFLVKNLRQHWKNGERWFWNCLFDADLANNCSSWQWVAGCGADAAPYFRIFNPVTQAQKFDPEGQYIRNYVPELASLPNKYLFAPWLAPLELLKAANITLGVNYPHPVVDLTVSRNLALEAFSLLKNIKE